MRKTAEFVDAGSELAQPRAAGVPNPGEATSATDPAHLEQPEPSERLLALRRRLEQEMREDVAAARAAGRLRGRKADLLPSGVDGLMPDPEDTEEPWR
jgi:hypothetical protein